MSVFLSPLAGAGWQLFDNNGVPLSGGKLETYVAGTSTPATTYTTSAGSIANSNPIVLDAYGRVNQEIWLTSGTAYKFVLKDATDNLIWTKDNISGINDFTGGSATILADLANTSDVAKGDALIGFKQANSSGVLTGAVGKTVHDKFQDAISVFDFMTPAQVAAVRAGTSTEDLSAAFENAINTSNLVRVPKGTYLVNVTINSKVILLGDGGNSTILKPYNNSVAIMTYTFTAQQTPVYSFWDYHSEVHGIGFYGKTSKTGVGFTFGTTVPANYATNMEYANNVKFFGCKFNNLQKGIQFPFGNIGTEFYSCGFQGNYYGAYLLDCKFPAGSPNTMHAGNKYWYAGEFSGNDVGLYVNNVTDGFGAVVLKDTIFEYNQCAAYLYIGPRTFVPVKFDSVWFEGNGSVSSGNPTVTVDTWTGATQGTTILNKKTIFIDGSNANVNFDSTTPTDMRVMGTNIAVKIKDSWVGRLAGYMGGAYEVDYPERSFIRVDSPYAQGGFPVGPSVYTTGAPIIEDLLITSSPNSANLRWFWTLPRSSKVKNYGPSLINSLSLTSVTQLTGTASVTGTIVADGRIFPVCNEFTQASFLSNQYLNVDNPTSNINIGTAGYYVVTVDVKRTQGSPRIYMWDRSAKQWTVSAEIPSANRWYTFAAIGYSDGTAGTIYLDFQGDGNTCTWRVSGYQVLRFDNYAEATQYLESGVYALKQTLITIPSAATIYLPQDADIVPISGTTSITSISATGQVGRTVTLQFADALTVTDGSNLKLAGNFVTTGDDTLTLTCDGTNWYEVARSTN